MLNPEFQRNLWLEWDAHRAILITVVLTSLFVFVSLFDAEGIADLVARFAAATFIITTIIWGGHRAGDALLDELRDKTWDSQRMSAIDPWPMTWGKLCGATVMPWFAGVLCLIVYLAMRDNIEITETLRTAVTLCAGAILLQSLSLIAALLATRQEKQARSTLLSWAALGTFGLLWIYFSAFGRAEEQFVWYGLDVARADFLMLSAMALAAWFVFGAYRLMSNELAVATMPWAWLTFIVYLSVYYGGLYIDLTWPVARSMNLFATIMLVISVGATYLAAFALYREPLAFRRLAQHWRKGNWRAAFEDTPVWLAALVLALFATLACASLQSSTRYSNEAIENFGLAAIPTFLYLVRNIGILYYFSFTKGQRRVETSTVICIALISWLIPSIIEGVGLDRLSWILRPPLEAKPLLSAGIICLHIAVVGGLIMHSYRARIAPPRT